MNVGTLSLYLQLLQSWELWQVVGHGGHTHTHPLFLMTPKGFSMVTSSWSRQVIWSTCCSYSSLLSDSGLSLSLGVAIILLDPSNHHLLCSGIDPLPQIPTVPTHSVSQPFLT